MKYSLKGKLSGYLSPTFKVPIANAKVRLFRVENAKKTLELKPKHAFALLSEERIGKDNQLLVSETMTDQKGHYRVELDQGQNYDGDTLRIDVYLTEAPGQKSQKRPSKPAQFTMAIMKPRWQKTSGGYTAHLSPVMHWRHFCDVLRLMGIWIICGRVLDSDTNAPVSGVTVHAFDADHTGNDDKLGQRITNTFGQFCINYSITDFVDLAPLQEFWDDAPLPFTGAGPDVFFRVEASSGILLLEEPSSEGRRRDRENIGPCFCVDLYVKESGKLYVAGNDTVTVVDIESNTVMDTITVGGQPSEVALTPDGSLAYVSNGSLNDVSVIDTATRTVVAAVPMGGVSRSLAMAPDGAHCYVSGRVDGSSCLWVIDTATNDVSTPIPLESDRYEGVAWDVVITPDGAKVYVTLYPNWVIAIDTDTNALASAIGLGNETHDLEVSIDGTRLYATGIYGDICVIDTATDAEINWIDTGVDGCHGIGVTPDETRVYAAGHDLISVVDIATETVIATLPYRHCGDTEITPGGSRAYISRSSELLAIDTATNTVIATVPGVYGDITLAPRIESYAF